MSSQIIVAQNPLYDQDYNLWIEKIIQQLRHCVLTITSEDHPLEAVDLKHLIEELESMGRHEKWAIYSNLKILLIHLLKYQYQPEKRTNSWRSTIREHRQRLQEAFRDSPSLKTYFNDVFERCYQAARELAAEEIGLAYNACRSVVPFAPAEVLNGDYLTD